MYSFYINIGSFASPSVGSGYVLADPFYDKCKITVARDGDSLRYMTKLTGGLIFHDDQAIVLKTLSATYLTVGLKVVYNSSDIWEGELQLIGKYNTQSDLCELEAVESSTLYSKIKANLSLKFPFTGIAAMEMSYFIAFTTWSNLIGHGIGTIGGSHETPVNYSESTEGLADIAAWDNAKAYTAAEEVATELWEGDFTNCFVSKNSDYFVCLLANTNKDPETETDYWLKLYEPDGFRSYRQERSKFDTQPSAFTWDAELKLWVKASLITDDYTILFANSYKIYDILVDILNKIDPNIEIYETTSGLNTGYIPYLESIHASTNGCYLIFHYFETDSKPIEEISLQDIIGFMKLMFNMDWKLEGNKFVFRHASEIPSTVGSDPQYDLTDYLGIDWTEWDEETKIEDKVYKESFKAGSSQNEDFEVQEIIYDNNYDTVKELNTNIETDISNFLLGDSGKCILLCEKDSIIYYVKNVNGLISGELCFNGYLAMSNCFYDHHRTGGRPFAKGTLSNNATEYTLTKKKNTVINLKVPYFYPSIIDPEEYLIHTSNGDLMVEEINIKLADGIAEIKAVK